ncbi:MAG: aliphatic sulfonate ABC transporter substrate-binding protein [Lachnospiraceae bacterium]|nr:aliphatic sulfonate ABC transporter substrate-binding protein [Lachnospiraceae bacterium]
MKKVFMVFISLILMTSLSACGKSSDETIEEVHIGYFNNITHAQALYMKANGTLEEALGNDRKVTWTSFNAGPAEVEALFAGEIDIGYIGPVPAITANVKSNGDVKILSSATKGGGILTAREGSGIHSVNDLNGKIVAIPQIGNTQHINLLKLLSDHGLAPVTDGGTVTVSAVANADVANLMKRGDIDAALVPEPWGATLLSGDAYMVLDYDEIYMDGTYDVAVVVVRTEFLEKQEDLVRIFLKQHQLATDEINADLTAACRIINEELLQATGKSLDEAVIAEAFKRIGVNTELNRDSINGFAEVSLQQGFIEKQPERDELYVTGLE